MNEPIFGSPMWPGTPPGFGWPPASAQGGNRMTAGGTGFSTPHFNAPQLTAIAPIGPIAGLRGPQHPSVGAPDPYGMGASPLGIQSPINGPMFGGGLPAGPGFGYTGGFSGFVPPDLAAYNLSTLLTAVAMRRGQPMGPTTDQEIEDFIYDTLEWLPLASDVEVRCENGRATLTGTVHQKRLKHDVGEIAWAIPGINDVQNNVTISARRRSRPGREAEAHTGTSGRKQS